MKAVIYARVSSREQEETGYSLPAQVKFLREYAERSALTISKVFQISESASGKVLRKAFHEMLDCAQKEHIGVILVESTDRLTRNFNETIEIDKWIHADINRQVHLVKEGCILQEASRSHEWFMWRVKVATAEYYIKLLSENVKKGQKEKVSQGWRPSAPVLGYKTVGDKGHKMHEIDKPVARFIIKAFELFASGNYSLRAIAERMYKEGLRTREGGKVHLSRMHIILRNPFYCGKMIWRGVESEGKHEPIVSVKMFEKVRSLLTRKTAGPQYRVHLPVFKAKVICAMCGGLVTWENQKGHWYGHCNGYRGCKVHKFVRQEVVEEQLFPFFVDAAPKSKAILEILEEAIREKHNGKSDDATLQYSDTESQIKEAENRMLVAYTDRIDGKIPVHIADRVINDAETQIKDLQEVLSHSARSRVPYWKAGFKVHQLAHDAMVIYQSEKTSNEERRMLLSKIFSNLSLDIDKISIKYTKEFQFLAEWMPRVNSTFEQSNLSSMKRKRGDCVASNPVVLRRQDSNL